MAEADRAFTGSIPEIYDQLMVPLIFTPYARDVTERLVKLKPRNILETAAGTGVVTRAMAAKLPADAHITVTDLNQPMLDRAKTHLADDRRITWAQVDAQALPFDDQAFDVVVCQFGVMFFPDKAKGYSEARRVLRAGGTFLFTVWDRLSENAFVDEIGATLAKVFPDDPPTFMARTPHGHYDMDKIRGELGAAGFVDIKVEAIAHMAKAKSPRDVATAYCQGTPVRAEIEARDKAGLERVTGIVTEAVARKFGSGAVEGAIRAYVISAVR